MNFLEGTRFTPQKHDRQQSPYKNLLKPKSAGMAYALNIMNERIDTLVDVTIYYPDGRPSFWQFMCGTAKNIEIHIQTRDIPTDVKVGDYENDAEFRKNFQTWVNHIWQQKDQRLEKMKQAAHQVLEFKKAS